MKRRTVPIESADSLGKLMARASPKQAAMLLEMLKHYRNEFRRVEAEGTANAESIAQSIHTLIDEHVAHLLSTDKNAHRVACKRGCAHCCHLWVTIDKHEAALLLHAANELKIAFDWERVERQATRNLRTWGDLPHADKACVFLGAEGECRVYEWRPNACRKYMVIDDPDLCDTVAHPGGRVGMLVSGKAEVVASAALVAFPGANSMAKMLLKARTP